ncbi:AraC-like ligand-binding domain-containing protein [Pseudonocardia phyllosphaerae]|uniref:AraC-like ligand-binding domain-containing protein n=1 Tax=Pseudonocardia phyllosphaerae TaxID=3390502 RepID=UPI003978B25B
MTPVTVRSVSEWADACSAAFVPLAVEATAPRFAAKLDQTELAAGVSVTRVASDGSVVSRGSGTITREPREDLLLSLHRVGRGRVEQHGRAADLRAGQAAAYDASVPYSLRFPGRMAELVLQVPRRVLGRNGHAFDDLTARVLPDSPSLTALTHLMTTLGADGDRPRDPAENDLLADAAVTLLRGALLPVGRPATSRIDTRALDAAMRAYVDHHLADPDLTVDKLAAEHHVSVRLVHKIFADTGESPAAYVRRKRLGHARALLRDGATVTAVARQAGFSDPDTFTRAFKREYGLPPSALRS